MQNIPIRSESGVRIREAFVPAEGHRLLSADYSQVELRILAHYSGDESLVEAFASGDDVHRRTAAEVAGIAPEAVTDEQRARAKAMNFGIIYGSRPSASRTSSASRRPRRRRPSTPTSRATRACAASSTRPSSRRARQGFVRTLLGRRRYLPDLASRNRALRQAAERMAVNTVIQGTAADLIKKAMVEVAAALRRGGPPAPHDPPGPRRARLRGPARGARAASRALVRERMERRARAATCPSWSRSARARTGARRTERLSGVPRGRSESEGPRRRRTGRIHGVPREIEPIQGRPTDPGGGCVPPSRRVPATDEAMRRARAGDHEAFRVLVERYQGRAYRLALRVLRDEEAARDAVQEAFVKAYTSLARFEGRSSFFTWLYRLVMNQCLDMRRRERARAAASNGRTASPLEDGALSLALDAGGAPAPSFAPPTQLARKELREQPGARVDAAARGGARDAAAARGRRALLRGDRRGAAAFRAAR